MTSQEKMVSVILPTYNRAYCLERSIRSVLEQTYENLELIIVDDGSTDQTGSLVASINDKRIRYISNDLNQGVSAARNIGLDCATGEYIAFQDSDDVWRLEKLQRQMEMIECENAGFCYHKMQYTSASGEIVIWPQENIPFERKKGDIYGQMFADNLVGCPTLLIRRECMEEIGGFDTSLTALEDYDLALRLSNAFRAAFVDEVLIDTNYTENSISRNVKNFLDASCELLFRYQKDYIDTNQVDRRIALILSNAQRIGMKEHYLNVLMKGIQ